MEKQSFETIIRALDQSGVRYLIEDVEQLKALRKEPSDG